MPNNTPKRQQQTAPRQTASRQTAPEPPWLGTALVAIRVMTVLIIIGLALLGYGIWDRYYADDAADDAAATATDNFASPSDARFTYPADMRFYQIATTKDGGMVVVLEGTDGNFVAITLDAAGRELGRLAIQRQE